LKPSLVCTKVVLLLEDQLPPRRELEPKVSMDTILSVSSKSKYLSGALCREFSCPNIIMGEKDGNDP
jgi:hypothetical protein